MSALEPLYMHRENRDKAWKAAGMPGRRTTYRNQLLHPQYVEDFIGTEKEDTGLGNTVYKTRFAVLYTWRH